MYRLILVALLSACTGARAPVREAAPEQVRPPSAARQRHAPAKAMPRKDRSDLSIPGKRNRDVEED